MKELFTLIPFIMIAVNSVQAQIGWTLDKCRERFGSEHNFILDKDSDTTWYDFSVDSYTNNKATGVESVTIAFDSDGTVGHIKWQKIGNAPYSMAEMEEHLKQASHTVVWKRVDHGRHTPNFDNQVVAESNWEGTLHGEVMFMASYRTVGSSENSLAIGNYGD
jgi:hypothetical protein